jgi:hypothetical protein
LNDPRCTPYLEDVVLDARDTGDEEDSGNTEGATEEAGLKEAVLYISPYSACIRCCRSFFSVGWSTGRTASGVARRPICC